MKASIRFDPTFAGMSIYLYEDRPEGRFVVKPTELEVEAVDYNREVEPTFRFSEHSGYEFLNSLVNALVQCGFKPDEIKAHDKQVEAIKAHLEDMRRLVFKEALPPQPI